MDKILRYDFISKGRYQITLMKDDGSIYVLDPEEIKGDDKESQQKYNCALFTANGFDEQGRIRPI